jgi:hypothetical protein
VMSKIAIAVLLILLTLAEPSFGCTVTMRGLRKEFRSASQVFVGEFVRFEDGERDKVPADLAEKWESLGKATFRIRKSWKGHSSGEISLFVNVLCDCPMRYLLPASGDEMLVFADKDGVIDSCNFQYVIQVEEEKKKVEAKIVTDKLNSFWFRTWARIYPF